LALIGNQVGGTEFYKDGRFYNPSISEEDARLMQNNKWSYIVGNIMGGLPATIATGGLAAGAASALGVTSTVALRAIGAAVPAAIQGGADAAAQGGDVGDIILGTVTNAAFAAVSFGALGTAAETAVGRLLANAPALLQKTLPAITGASVTAIADTGLNILSDTVMGRDVDWSQTFATMGVDFLFSLFLSGKNGNTYLDPQTGKTIDVPEGKTLISVDPEAAAFYESLGNSKMTGEMHNAVGDIYLNYMDIPESVVPNQQFAPLETAYRNYEANPTIANASTFLDEAGKVQRLAGNGGYSVDSPYVKMNAAIEAGTAGTQMMIDDGDVSKVDSETDSKYNHNVGTGEYLPDIEIYKSLGAKANNYDILAPDGEIINLSEGTFIRKVEVIAGHGKNRKIDMVDDLIYKYGGDESKWMKCKGFGYVNVDGESLLAELHWYEEPNVGRVEFKIKRQSGGGWFINED
jgi:hypothetical protein